MPSFREKLKAKGHWIGDDGSRHWNATQAGLEVLANGEVTQRIHDQTTASAPHAPRPQASAGERLQELETLRASGVITDAEYTAKRQRIIEEP
ncbi:hypothetical protein GCM10009641_06490 [Mycobacterium cookii]|uniref:SHOCT domain-containing protein n=1 Tax=Mycobacterium cookii TaxID=1775 RepID=A0A7I7L2Z4_9MYCO|nr:hypothetical protein MCOO_43210 [Mycobacterium cookii]